MKTLVRVIYSVILGIEMAALTGCAGTAAAEIRGKTSRAAVAEPETLPGSFQEASEPFASTQDIMQETDGDKNKKVLVVYFSCTGTTRTLAQYAAQILGGDLYEIVPQEPYTEADLAYYTGGRADQEQNDESVRPQISGSVEQMDSYGTIVLAYPIWHGQAPRIVSTFLENYDFSGKTILPFCTSHSSGIGSSAENLHGLCSDSVIWLDGKRFESQTSRPEMETWLESQLGDGNER